MKLEHLDTAQQVWERTWTAEEIPVLSASITLPCSADTKKDRLLHRIDRYYRQFAHSYLRYCDSFLYPAAAAEFRLAVQNGAPLPHFTATMNYQITWNEGGIWSLYTDATEKGWIPFRVRRSDTWDLYTGTPMSLSAFLPSRPAPRRFLTNCAAAEIQKQLNAGTAFYREDWQKRLRRAWNPDNYYLTREGLCFFYQMYTLAPAAEGTPTFCIPWEGGASIPNAHRLSE